MTAPAPLPPLRPADICRRLLAALDATEGRRRRRKRDTTPDAIGMGLKRRLLEDTVRHDPDPKDYEGWLLGRCRLLAEASARRRGDRGPVLPTGPVRAMALDVLGEWRLAQVSEPFRDWLDGGAPSADAD